MTPHLQDPAILDHRSTIGGIQRRIEALSRFLSYRKHTCKHVYSLSFIPSIRCTAFILPFSYSSSWTTNIIYYSWKKNTGKLQCSPSPSNKYAYESFAVMHLYLPQILDYKTFIFSTTFQAQIKQLFSLQYICTSEELDWTRSSSFFRDLFYHGLSLREFHLIV